MHFVCTAVISFFIIIEDYSGLFSGIQEEIDMYLMIDNYDSFVYNLKAYFEEIGREIEVKRSDRITMEDIEKMNPEGIILSLMPPALLSFF